MDRKLPVKAMTVKKGPKKITMTEYTKTPKVNAYKSISRTLPKKG